MKFPTEGSFWRALNACCGNENSRKHVDEKAWLKVSVKDTVGKYSFRAKLFHTDDKNKKKNTKVNGFYWNSNQKKALTLNI